MAMMNVKADNLEAKNMKNDEKLSALLEPKLE